MMDKLCYLKIKRIGQTEKGELHNNNIDKNNNFFVIILTGCKRKRDNFKVYKVLHFFCYLFP